MSSFYSRWGKPLIRTEIISALAKYPRYLADIFRYSRMEGAEHLILRNTYPCLFDRTAKTSIEGHYFYQHIWAMEKILARRPSLHVDIGSNVDFVGLLSTITKVHFVDIRPMQVNNLPNLEIKYGSILDLPYEDDSLESISCLHVAEHIGLGRYGDPLDPRGTEKAAVELTRCLAVGGYLYFSVPVGRPRLCFNAHRIHSPSLILEYFADLELVEFFGTDDHNNFLRNTDIKPFETADYACGMYLFTKKMP